MCFSANASFIAGVTLSVAGVISIAQVRKPSHLLFASIPLLFGIQQLCEGVLWLSFSDPEFSKLNIPAKYTFLFFAQFIWPFWIPLSFLLIEKSPKRRKIINYFLYGGIIISLLLLYRLIFYTATAYIEGCHIVYYIESPKLILVITTILYLGAIVVAPFFSSWKLATLLAVVNLLSLITTEFFFKLYFISIWCFFAAIQSVIIIFVMKEIRKNRANVRVSSE